MMGMSMMGMIFYREGTAIGDSGLVLYHPLSSFGCFSSFGFRRPLSLWERGQEGACACKKPVFIRFGGNNIQRCGNWFIASKRGRNSSGYEFKKWLNATRVPEDDVAAEKRWIEEIAAKRRESD